MRMAISRRSLFRLLFPSAMLSIMPNFKSLSNPLNNLNIETNLPHLSEVDQKQGNALSNFFGAKGDGSSDDSAAFAKLELTSKNAIIDLEGKSYAVNNPFSGNFYNNGFYIIAGIKHPVSVEIAKLNKIKLCAIFNTGDPKIPGEKPIFEGSAGVFQSACIVCINGIMKLYVTNRSSTKNNSEPSYGNFLKGETYRIIEYNFSESGSEIKPVSFSQPLNTLGHATMLNYRIEDDVLYFYSSSSNLSIKDKTAGGKGFTKIRWKGVATSNKDVTNYNLFNNSISGLQKYKELNKANVCVSGDGSFLCVVADNDKQSYTILIYKLDNLLKSVEKNSNMPLTEFNIPKNKNCVFQGVTLNNNTIFILYDNLEDSAKLECYDYFGKCVGEINNLDLFKMGIDENVFSYSVPVTVEYESVFLYAGDLYIGLREIWNEVKDVVIYNGKYYAPRKKTKGNSPDNKKYWWEINKFIDAVAYSEEKNYKADGVRIRNLKKIFRLSSIY